MGILSLSLLRARLTPWSALSSCGLSPLSRGLLLPRWLHPSVCLCREETGRRCLPRSVSHEGCCPEMTSAKSWHKGGAPNGELQVGLNQSCAGLLFVSPESCSPFPGSARIELIIAQIHLAHWGSYQTAQSPRARPSQSRAGSYPACCARQPPRSFPRWMRDKWHTTLGVSSGVYPQGHLSCGPTRVLPWGPSAREETGSTGEGTHQLQP